MRLFALALLTVALTACGSDTAVSDTSSTDAATPIAESSDASAIVGFWNEDGRKSALDADLRGCLGRAPW
ncbi:MAG: hypothetical protein AAF170_18325 [Bacteroidota bacterium]